MQVVTAAKQIKEISHFFVNINKSPLGAPAFDFENIGTEFQLLGFDKHICLNMVAKSFLDGVCIKIISKLGQDNGRAKTNYLDFLLITEEVYVSDCVWPVACREDGCNAKFCDCLSKFSSTFSKF